MRSERGTASVELAAALPLAAIVLLLVAQVGLYAASALTAVHAAREGARAAAVWNDDDRAREAALAAGGYGSGGATVSVAPAGRIVGTPVSVTVRAPVPRMPLVERFLPSPLEAAATVTFRTERERPPDEG